MSYHIIESDGKFILLQVLDYGENVLSRPVCETKTLAEMKKVITEDLVPVNAVSADKVAGLTGEPPVKKKKRVPILSRIHKLKNCR